jgi:hypothetical protein
MSGWGIVQTITYVGLAVSVVSVISVLRLHGHAWKEAGRRKWLWVLLPIATYFILLSIPLALWYYAAVRPSVARADANCIATRRSRGRQRVYAANALQGACKWCTNGMRACDACRPMGSGFKNDLSRPYCWQCSGSGEVKCTVCAGTGLA